MREAECDHIVVGAGAGGGTLAARLAEAGRRVVLLDAGGDPRTADDPRLPDDYDVPGFHPFASENPALRWDFFVRHYHDAAQQERDPYFLKQHGGVLYPRAAGLGGCTAHNAMIFVAAPDADWDAIATLTGDQDWSGAAMQRHFRAIENCHHRPAWRVPGLLGFDLTGHGRRGWLHTECALPIAARSDHPLLRLLWDAGTFAIAAEGRPGDAVCRLLVDEFDPNDRRAARKGFEGPCYLPLATRAHRRNGTRERVLDVQRRFPDRLRIETDALATRVLLEPDGTVNGLEYRKGAGLYRAHARPSGEPGETRWLRARGDIVLAGGTFNTPQLLMLSGIGDPMALAALGIRPVVDLPGVGRNLQDRYEVGVVNRMAEPWSVLAGARFAFNDTLYRHWSRGTGMYMSNGAAMAVMRRSSPTMPLPDLVCMALLADFSGYFPGYAKKIAASKNHLTWAILKAHTANRAGRVTLRSADPREPPDIQFNFFTGDGAEADLAAIVEGICFVRRMTAPLIAQNVIAEEEVPGSKIANREELEKFVRDHAWGHHAVGTCAIGPRAGGGVLDGALRVHGVRGLRVADASVFPRIPGTFIASAVMMVGERAAELLLQ